MPLIILFSLLIIAVFWLDSLPVYRILYVTANLSVLIILFTAAEILSAFLPFVPWYQVNGLSPVVIIYLAVWLSIFGVIQSALSKYIKIGRPLKYLPFAGAALLSLSIVLPADFSPAIQIFGSVAALVLTIVQVILFALNFKNVFK